MPRKKRTKHNKKNSHKRTHKKEYCAPSSETNSISGLKTCYTNDKLQKMRHYWNKRHPDALITSTKQQDIWYLLKNYMSGVCNTERCWLKQKYISESGDYDLLNYTFVPDSPISWHKDPNEWLTSIDIENVMKQYEKAYPCFQFLGPSPIDFDKRKSGNTCVWDELCHFSLTNFLQKGCNKIGIIFNTDPHYLNGSHWIALFVNIKQKYIYYFDSVGQSVPKEVDILMKRIAEQGKELNIDFTLMKNKVQHQKSNTECGMYCLYFIINSLKDKHPERSLRERIPDEEMEKFRKIYFNPKEV